MADSWSHCTIENGSKRLEVEQATTTFAFTRLTATDSANLDILVEFADFWKIPYSTIPDRQDDNVQVSSGIPRDHSRMHDRPLVIIPSTPEDYRKICESYSLRTVEKKETIRLPTAPGAFTAIRAMVTEFQGSGLEPLLRSKNVTVLSRIQGTRTSLVSLDIVTMYRRLIYQGLEDEPSSTFRLVSRMPVSYHLVPRSLREWSLRRAGQIDRPNEEDIGPVECLRTIFLASIVLTSQGQVPTIAFWPRGWRYVASITHDTESREGLEEGGRNLLATETRLGIRATWNLPSDRYPVSARMLKALAGAGDIGAHDTAHDGRLILVTLEAQLERVSRCKRKLEQIGGTYIAGFRSPLLQHSRELLKAVGMAGYEFDSSVPSWEPMSPTSRKPHGIGTVFPLQINGVTEIPVTLPQDHQLLRVMKLSPREAVNELLRLSGWIRMTRGACIVLVHPDYDFGQADYLEEYGRLLEEFRSDQDCKIMTMREIADWWKTRSETYVDLSSGQAEINSVQRNISTERFELQIVRGYGSNGFETLA